MDGSDVVEGKRVIASRKYREKKKEQEKEAENIISAIS